MSNNKLPLETAKLIYGVIKEAVDFHRAIEEGLVDALVWDNVVPTKEGGKRCLNRMLDEDIGELRSEIDDYSKYWEERYDDLKRQVFYREDPTIIRSEKKKKH